MCDCCNRKMGDIGAFLMEHSGEKDYCFDCVVARPLGVKNAPLKFRPHILEKIKATDKFIESMVGFV